MCVVWDQQATYSTHLTSNLFQYIGKVGHEMKPTKYVYMCMYVYIYLEHIVIGTCMHANRQTDKQAYVSNIRTYVIVCVHLCAASTFN